jgi:hypothetical protein
MQGEQRDFIDWHPAHLLTFIIGGVGRDLIICSSKHCVIPPVTVIITKES